MVKIAQIGVGYWGPNLLRNIVANKRCRVSLVADLSSERRDYVKGLYPAVELTDDVDEVFNDVLGQVEADEIGIIGKVPQRGDLELNIKLFHVGEVAELVGKQFPHGLL